MDVIILGLTVNTLQYPLTRSVENLHALLQCITSLYTNALLLFEDALLVMRKFILIAGTAVWEVDYTNSVFTRRLVPSPLRH